MNEDKIEMCKARTYSNFYPETCSRRAWKDGYCKQHHPDTVKSRNASRQEKYEAEYKAKEAAWEAARKAKDIERRKLALYPELVAALQSMTGQTPLLDRVYEIEREEKGGGK